MLSNALSIEKPKWVYNDGGRSDTKGFTKTAGDCCVRALAIAANVSYIDAYNLIREEQCVCPDNGTERKVMKKVLSDLGWSWVPVMKIGSGCTMHVRSSKILLVENYYQNTTNLLL